MTSKTAEAEKMMKEAESKTKTGFFKSPDYDLAASLYTKAATIFKNMKEPIKCMECHLRAADCCSKNKIPFQAAKSIEQAMYSARDAGDFKKTAELVRQSSTLYYDCGVMDAACSVLEKGAKIIEDQLPQEASSLFQKGATYAQLTDKHLLASEMLDKATRLLVKMEKYDEAASLLKEVVQHVLENPGSTAGNGPKLALYSVILNLKRGDYVAARVALESACQIPNCDQSTEARLAVQILNHFDQGDRNSLKTACNNPFMRSLDPTYALLARSIDVAEGDFGPYDESQSAPQSEPLSKFESRTTQPTEPEIPADTPPEDTGSQSEKKAVEEQGDFDLT